MPSTKAALTPRDPRLQTWTWVRDCVTHAQAISTPKDTWLIIWTLLKEHAWGLNTHPHTGCYSLKHNDYYMDLGKKCTHWGYTHTHKPIQTTMKSRGPILLIS